MSLSNPRATVSPVKKHFRFKGQTGEIAYYDKDAKQEVKVETPFRFTVLDVTSSIRGWDDNSQSGVWANEVRDLRSDILRVRSKGGLIAEGLYATIKERVRGRGGKFANIAYIAYKDGDELAIGTVTFVGSSLSAWIEFTNGRRIDSDPGVVIKGFAEQKKGATTYYSPLFERMDVSGETLQRASDLDVELQAYLSESLKAQDEVAPQEPRDESPWGQVTGSFGGGADLTAAAPF
ncbi:hypothetical protein PBI_GAIA_93 [Mycobacterium phage Gaia]|uniref:Uncharacterized protein n=1 Tax=Mycobacterium phage Gaia TaxID=1486472 RepID=A0A068F1T8_9CAUD|nr:hypothetical protein VC46_gp140 [Mycobacterium phage Gaia]AID58912.1 hypothetical protein PBI_GAIA_93 [Mycobacterium phage Gaia]